VFERGHRLDWFESSLITTLVCVAAVSIVLFIWRELTTPEPVVDLSVLRYRNLTIGCLLGVAMSVGLFGLIFLFPVFAQNLLGFTAMQTGLILLPGGLATAFMMPIVGKLLQRGVPAQLMNALGFVSFFFFTYLLSRSTLSSGHNDFFWPLILRGVGLGLLFVPLTTLALSNLRGKDIAQGAGMTNMMRQLGGSFGVALIATYVQKRSWAHRQTLLEHVTIYDPALRERFQAIVSGLMARGSTLAEATQQAYGAVEGLVVRQTFLLTYMDAFRIVGVFFLCCIPLLLLFKGRGRGARPAEPVMAH
jgi:MFS transporter, DHA2 family, multidrug resistance protein